MICASAGGIRPGWRLVGVAGTLWMLLGLFFLLNAFCIGMRIWPGWFAILLCFDGLASLAAAVAQAGSARGLRVFKAVSFLAVAAVIAVSAGRAEMAVGALVGTFLIADAVARSAIAYRRRFDGWRRAIVFGVGELMLGIWTLLAYPTDGVVGSDVSLLVMNSAFSLCMRAVRLRREQMGTPARALAMQ